jgi:hypothetical protein
VHPLIGSTSADEPTREQISSCVVMRPNRTWLELEGTMIRFLMALLMFTGFFFVATPRIVDACAGLIGSNGAVNLGRTSTLAAYSDGVEHYVTAFEFQGGGGEFGTLVPLPGVPTEVERGGAWTLQRIDLETAPPAPLRSASRAEDAVAGSGGATVLLETRIDALDLTVLEGGAPDVADWAQEHGFRLSPDAPEVLDFYAQRSPIFLAAVFDGAAAEERGQALGDGTPVHLTIPTDNPWVPLRILGLGKQPQGRVEADVFLMTDDLPAIMPEARGLSLDYNAAASASLLNDLRSDDGMGWVPESAWITRIGIDTTVSDLKFDLAVDASGRGKPSPVAAGVRSGRLFDADDDSWFDPSRGYLFGGVTILALLIVAKRLWRGAIPPGTR